MTTRVTRPLALAAAILCLLFPSRASTALPLDLTALCGQADVIQVARVASAESRWGTRLGREAILTTFRFEGLEVIAGEPLLELTVFGGRVGPERAVLEGQPQLKPGDRVLLILHSQPTQSPFVGLWQGAYRLTPQGVYRGDRALIDVERSGALHFASDNELAMPVDAFVEEVERCHERALRLAEIERAFSEAVVQADSEREHTK
jgi:hypothetical protein